MAVIQVPDRQDPDKSYLPMDERFLWVYMWQKGIDSNLYSSAVAEIKKNHGFFTKNYIKRLQDISAQLLCPTAPLGSYDGQHNYRSLICHTTIGNDPYEPEQAETFYW